MVSIDIRYDGQLGTTAVHGPSKTALTTDAPVDNAGRGLSFSPTDLLATALGTCVLTTMAIVAQRHGIELTGGVGEVRKRMTTDGPRRIERIEINLKLPGAVPEVDRPRLEQAGHRCPVQLSLHPDVRVDLRFEWSL